MTAEAATVAVVSSANDRVEAVVRVGASAWLAAIILVFVYLSYLSPVSGDMWANLNNFAGASLRALMKGVGHSYEDGNPRLGENLVKLAAESRLAWIAISTLVFVFYLWVTTRLIRQATQFVTGNDVAVPGPLVAALVASLTFLLVPLPGPALFYPPFEDNYLFGVTLLLFAVSIVFRRVVDVLNLAPAASRRSPAVEATLVAGGLLVCFLAGMSNEHTALAALIVFAAALVGLAWRRRYDAVLFGYAIAFAGGFCFLYFAPGQLQRYGGAGAVPLASYFGENATFLASVFGRSVIPAAIVSLALLAASVIAAPRLGREGKRLAAVSALLFLIAWGSVAVLLLAPFYILPGGWAPRVFIPFGVITIVMLLIGLWALPGPRRAVPIVAGVLALNWLVQIGILIPVYRTTFEDQTARAGQIAEQIAGGKYDVTVDAYRLDPSHNQIYADRAMAAGEDSHQQQSMFDYYGIYSVTEVPPTRPR